MAVMSYSHLAQESGWDSNPEWGIYGLKNFHWMQLSLASKKNVLKHELFFNTMTSKTDPFGIKLRRWHSKIENEKLKLLFKFFRFCFRPILYLAIFFTTAPNFSASNGNIFAVKKKPSESFSQEMQIDAYFKLHNILF